MNGDYTDHWALQSMNGVHPKNIQAVFLSEDESFFFFTLFTSFAEAAFNTGFSVNSLGTHIACCDFSPTLKKQVFGQENLSGTMVTLW